ncbi:replicative DNA helicase [Pseudomonas syringae]|uniref:DNA 5'-3' helicase n=1 Tax=Pseudomonas syringae pv. syringae TaxID=321 RepID=A0AAE5VUQ8_PSESY|nr:DnaB-like helicase C-terminal domain-containing protein [Pseudomonas syringae]POQ03675.1 helicase DnaB [Pseudomonas syringae pv. syringae]
MSRELYSLEAEHGLLGALLLDASLFDAITARITTADFAYDDNAAMYQAIIDTHAAGQPVDVVTVGFAYPDLPSGERTLAYASEIAKNIPSTANWAGYQRIVLERSALRRVVEAAEVIKDSASESLPVAEIIALAQQATADLRDLGAPDRKDYYRYSEVLPGVIDGIDSRFNGAAQLGHETGLKDLDELIRGLRKKNMIVIAGLPGSGKTSLGVQIAQKIACTDNGVGLIVSMEMTKEELVTRGLASVGGISLTRIDQGHTLQDDDWPRLTSAVNVLQNAKLFVCDEEGMTAARIRSTARQVQRKEGLSIVVVDYIGLIAAEGAGQNRTLELGKISTALKNMAKELDVPVIVLAQLNRGSTNRTDKKPRPSDLRDSGQIEADADVVILVHRDPDSEQGQNGVTELIVGKCRHAKTGSCMVQQQGQFVRFVDFAGNSYATDEEVEMGRTFANRGYRGRAGNE